ncbi:Hypothetical predicted protein [Olea europaea subsp. europaea]|uniref:J domain-containing protein n=1 Tax=Olea europaea subsp. europaea TaxID=158383 RepID=A0A8S0PBX7_OLEEU|nr:Hypothetical predicted protein [Olea europaea subsp. europaea]
MEFNKDEATRLKAIAEKKLKEEDIAGAKIYALKADNLFPSLDDLPQLLNVINFYDGYEKKINGEVNWYGILRVDPLADMDTLRKAHKRIAVALHPDKNKSFGAEEAFKLLSQAHSVLFDRGNKLVYDMKLNFRAHQRVSVGNPPFPADKCSFGNFTGCSRSATNLTASGKAQNVPMCPRNPATTTGSHYNPPPLWPRNQSTAFGGQHIPTLQMTPETATCSQYVLAPPWPRDPTAASASWHMTPEAAAIFYHVHVHNHQNPPTIATSFQGFPTPFIPENKTPTRHHQHSPFSNSLLIPSPPASRPETFWTLCNKCQMLYEFLKIYLDQTLLCPYCREPFLAKEESAPAAGSIRGLLFPWSFHHQKPGSSAAAGGSKSATALATGTTKTAQRVQSAGVSLKRGRKEAAAHTISFGNLKGSFGAERVTLASDQSTSIKESSQSELRIMLMGKAKREICEKLKQWNLAPELESTNKKGINMEKEKPSAIKDLKNNKNKGEPQDSSICDGTDVLNASVKETVLMSVPDANFCNFDKDRVEASFSKKQVWALYDDDDGMPRYYALIHGVMSRNPFKMQISWLNSNSTAEFGPLNWLSSGFVKTSGYFRVGKPEVNKSLRSFSHQVKWRKAARGAIEIYPAKGDVWALYRNWSVDWNELTEDEVIHKYDMVVIVEDYNEDKGVVVSPLIKVAGFTSVFCQHLDSIEIHTIPREEMFRFSHQVPSYMLTGREAPNVPKDSWDLDPASLPMELLQHLTVSEETDGSSEAKKESNRNCNSNTDGGGASENVKHGSPEPFFKYSRRGKKMKMAGDADHV